MKQCQKSTLCIQHFPSHAAVSVIYIKKKKKEGFRADIISY